MIGRLETSGAGNSDIKQSSGFSRTIRSMQRPAALPVTQCPET